ncbi:MAG TPA: hypothetical protein VF070_45440 [Streptosporangiaceae bacterium]
MNGTPGGVITVGTRLCFDGGLWEVTELTASAVVLRDALGGLRQASISGLLADPATRLLNTAPAAPASAGPGMSGLTPPEAVERGGDEVAVDLVCDLYAVVAEPARDLGDRDAFG